MKYYVGKVYSGGQIVGMISAVSMINLKRKASQLCNNYNSLIDNMSVIIYEDDDIIGTVDLRRFNKKSPNNEIKRGKWS